MNAIANRSGSTAVAALAGLKKGLQNVATTIVTPGGDYLLRLLKDGLWVYGAENVEVEDDSEWAVNPLSLQHGWIAWTDYKKKKNEVLAEVMVPLTSPLPDYASLRKVQDDDGNELEYVQQISFQLQCMTGADKGEQVLYKATSVGGMNASKGLLNSIIQQLDTDENNPVPILVLGSDSYIHKTYGKTYVPEFEIVDWVPLDGDIKEPMPTEAPDDDVKASEPAPQAERTRTRQSAPAVPAADATVGISAEDRKRAIDAQMQDLANERAAARRSQAEAAKAEPASEEPARTRRRR